MTTYETGDAEATQMTRTKLETYFDALNLLAHAGPMNLPNCIYKTHIPGCTQENYMTFLLKQGLAEERTVEMKSAHYVVTTLGLTVLKFFAEH
jgi:predicted transcriptional regulator